jgi:peptidoglycan/xylan/chitin deacetylase (PgdA/CDA1 family)
MINKYHNELYWVKTNSYQEAILSIYMDLPNTEKKVYLTSDDILPEITEWVLEQLELHNAKATFFVLEEY